MRRELLLSPRKQNYYDYMIETAVLFGANRTLAQTELRQIMEFEVALAKVSIIHTQLKFCMNSFLLLFLIGDPMEQSLKFCRSL